MTRRTSRFASSLVFCCLSAAAAAMAAPDDRIDALPEDQRAWLEEEVVYIITDVEKDVFLNLQTRDERERFIEAFWDRRDPDPGTVVNEFKEEHYRRLEHALSVLGREAVRPGWRTDQGMYYIILGPPQEVQRYYGQNEVHDCEIWYYTGDASLGLPARFNLLFFKELDVGEYKLYHPYADGPESLLRASEFFRANQNTAVDRLEMVSMDLARASLTIDLSEPISQFLSARNSVDPQMLQVRPSISVDQNLAAISEAATRKIDTDYLDGYLKYGDRVSADYSFKFVPSTSAFSVLLAPDATPFVHYSIEIAPEDFAMGRDEEQNTFYTALEVTLEVRDTDGRLMAVAANAPFLQLSASQLEQAQRFPFCYRDNFPLLPGDYQISVILKNRVNNQFTVADSEITIPRVSESTPTLGDVILAYQIERFTDSSAGEHQTFQIGGMQVSPSVGGAFSIGSTVQAAAQVMGTSPEHRVRFSLLSEDGETHQEEVVSVGSADGELVLADLALLQLQGGSYDVRVELLDTTDTVVASRTKSLSVSPRSNLPRPAFIYRHSFNAEVAGLLDMTLGEQHMARGELEAAEARLRRAVAAENEQLPMAKWKLASAVLFKRNADEALELLLPLKDDYPNEVEVVEGLGFSYYLKKDYGEALGFLEHAMTLRQPDTSLLNAVGDCYENLGESAKAREVFERSLEINPEQQGVKARLAGLGAGD